MILTGYYRFEKLQDIKSKTRIDCTASTGNNSKLESMRNKKGALFIHILKNTYTNPGETNQSDLTLSKKDHISSLYCPVLKFPCYYGDLHRTTDAIIVVLMNFRMINGVVQTGSVVEVYVAKEQRHNSKLLYNNFVNGSLNEEIKYLHCNVCV